MKTVTFIFLLLPLISFSQTSTFELSSSFGYGNIEGHHGYSVDGEFTIPLFKNLRVGLYYNALNSNKETEPVSDLTLQLISEGFFEIQADDYHRNVQRSQNSLGVIAAIDVINSGKINFNIGGGLNYNFYKMLDFTINRLNPDPTITYYKWHDQGVGFHFSSNLFYAISRNISVGIKSRLMNFKDYNGAIMLGTQIRLYQE